MGRIAVIDDYQGAAHRMADWSGLDVTFFTERIDDRLATALAEFEVIVVMRERTAFPDEVLASLPALRLIVTPGAANAAIDVAAARRLGIEVRGTASVATPTAELAWALIMATRRGLLVEDAAVREGRWQVGVPRELASSTLGLLGFGRLGTMICGYARAFGMTVLTWSEHMTPERAAERGAEAVGFDELFERSDIVSVHLKLSPETTGLVGPEQLRLLGPGGHLVNTSRAPIVDGAALVAALHDGVIAGAALDVFEVEPLPADDPLRSTPRTILSPHMGFVGDAAYRSIYGEAVDDIRAWLEGAPLRNL